MLTVIAAASDPMQVDADLLAVPVFKGGIEGPGAGPVLDALGLDDFPVTPCFRGDIGQHLLLAAPGLRAGGVLLVGLGRMDASNPERLRHAAGVAAQACRGVARVATTLAEVHVNRAAVEAIAEGFHLGAYTDRRFKAADEAEAPRLAEVTLLVPSSLLSDAREGIARATVYARATCAARDLVNLPPDRKRPEDLVAAIRALVAGLCDVTVRDENALAEQGFGGLLAVGRGSSAPPRLVELRYRPPAPIAHVVLVGKGITFDAGGLNLKRGTHMETQKKDMAGAAAVAAVMAALADLDVRLQVTGLLPLVENMLGADAQRPGDVVTIHGGTTVEVRDTDAEGRLVLADALDYGVTLRPQTIIDIATLTGTSAALGRYAGALMGNDDDLVDELRAAALVVGEDLWPLPLWPELERFLDTPIADLNNTGDGAGGGTIMGGLFLKRFVGDCPWAHLDIAGPAFLSSELATGHLPPGATGFGVRTLLAWLERRGA
ncbi:MAG: leucyl aminopeptidase [Egibacteraceae bacterium]